MSTNSRVAVVTGSNKGIGYAIVKELCAKFDGVVYLTSRNESLGEAAVAELEKLGLHPRYHQLDINNEESVIKLRDYMKEKYGGLDVLVNNAAIIFKPGTTVPFSEQATTTLRTNFFSTERACQILFPILKPHARVVNLSSVMGYLPKIAGKEPGAGQLRSKLASPDLTADELREIMQNYVEAAQRGDHVELGWPNSNYVVSKVGISALTRIQQREFNKDPRPDLVVNFVHPGYVATDMNNHEGPLSIEEGAVAPSWLALLPPNIQHPKGEFIWRDKSTVDWVNGPTPTAI